MGQPRIESPKGRYWDLNDPEERAEFVARLEEEMGLEELEGDYILL